MVDRVKTTRPATLLWIGTTSSLVFAALSLIATHEGIFDLDRSTHALVGLTRHDFLHDAMYTVSLLGQGTGLVPLIALASLIVWRHNRRWALALPIVMAGTGAMQFLAKWAVDRPRPNGAAWGYPSGHTLSVVVLFGIVAYLLWMSQTRCQWRCAGATFCTVTVLAVGFSRLYLDMHWLSDVGGGLAMGLAYLALVVWLVEGIAARAPIQPARPLEAAGGLAPEGSVK